MAESGASDVGGDSEVRKASRSASIADSGIHTGEDFAQLMSALMSDVIEGSIDPGVANAACNAGGKLLKVVEMQYRYGSNEPAQRPAFVLAAPRG